MSRRSFCVAWDCAPLSLELASGPLAGAESLTLIDSGVKEILTELQRCIAHRLRNVGVKLQHHPRGPAMAECKQIFAAPWKPEAVRRFRAWSQHWQVEAERGVRLGKDFYHLLHYYAFPPELWKKLCTTNLLERNVPRVPTTDPTDAGVSESKEYGEDLFRRDQLPQPEMGGAPSMSNFPQKPFGTAGASRTATKVLSVWRLQRRAANYRLLAIAGGAGGGS